MPLKMSRAPLRALAALVAVVLAVPVWADAREGADEVWDRLSHIEGAFRRGDADALRRSLSSSGKVRVDLGAVAEAQGSYGAGQLQVLFGQVFGRQPTREFAFRPADVKVSPSGTAFARGKWIRGSGGREREDTLTFTLRHESGDWRIVEIRTSR
jgi:hypothetical protein